MRVDPPVAKAYYADVTGAADGGGNGTYWTVPCDAILPDLTLTIASTEIVIPGYMLLTHSQRPPGSGSKKPSLLSYPKDF